jgi:SmpA / OmlA family
MPGRVYLLGVGLALVVGALLLTDRLLWEPGLTEDNVRRIRPGMTLAEVEALLGGPAADTFEMPADYPAYRWQREWRAKGAAVEVQFTADGRVMAAAGRGRPRSGILARVRSWLGW